MSVFRFAHPLAFILLILPLVMGYLMLRRRWTTLPPLIQYSDTRLVSGLPLSWRVRLRHLPNILRATAWIVLVIALARPQSGQAREILRGQGIDIVFALDISGSMDAPDFDPINRLEAAKSVMIDFINQREFDRIGLVVFADTAFQQAPLTLDYDILIRLIEEIRLAPELGLGTETAIGSGLASAANMLRSSTATTRIIILLTDGANNTGNLAPITVAEAVATLGIRVYTIGMGDPTFQDGELDIVTLTSIAEITGGNYFQANDTVGLQNTYDLINNLERSTVERQLFVRWQDQAMHLIVAALILLILERVLRHTFFQTLP